MNQTQRWITAAGAVLVATGIAMDAFGAHALEHRISERMLDVHATAARYHMLHGLAILIIGLARHRLDRIAAHTALACFAFGLMAFSASLYAMAISDGGFRAGLIVPIGGAGYIFGWLTLAWAAFRSPPRVDAPAK
ncbi:MAG: DUF423 domain-containing protein [Phycisphaeraceae bacterium]|nr:DUF423 domain-containing protein [Phycisphaeraceae bacterium]